MQDLVLLTNDTEKLVALISQKVTESLLKANAVTPPVTEQAEKPIKMQEASELLDLAIPTIYSKVSRGELPAMRRGNRLYFLRSELLAYLKAGRKKSSEDIFLEVDSYLANQKK